MMDNEHWTAHVEGSLADSFTGEAGLAVRLTGGFGWKSRRTGGVNLNAKFR
jgi:hypothetical protein